MMQSPDGISFTPMFSNRSLGWSDTKNVMFWSAEVAKYVAYIRIDNPSPDPHVDFPCANPWLIAGTSPSGPIFTVLTALSWVWVGMRGHKVLPSPVCA